MIKVFLLCALLATQWKPTPYEFCFETNEFRIIVVELVRPDVPGAKGKMLVRAMKVKYSVPTSDLAEDRATAILLGVSPDDAMLIDATQYSGAAWAESPKLRQAKVEFYAGDRLVASREIWTLEDPYHIKGSRIYAMARALYEQEQKKKPGSESSPRLVYGAADGLPRFPVINQRDSFTTGRRRSGRRTTARQRQVKPKHFR